MASASCFPEQSSAATTKVAALVEQRVRDWQPTKAERLVDQVGWAADLVEAQRLAKKHQRPLFLFRYHEVCQEV